MGRGRFIFTVGILFVLASAVFPEEGKQPAVGMSFEVVEESPMLGLVLWVSERWTVEPALGFMWLGSDSWSASRVMPQLTLALHGRPGSDLRPYGGASFGLDMSNATDSTYTDFILGLFGGAEYRFSRHFSVRGSFQVKGIKTDKSRSASLSLAPDAGYLLTEQHLQAVMYF